MHKEEKSQTVGNEVKGVIYEKISTTRDIAAITAEIKELNRQAHRMALAYAIEIGRRLCEAKDMLAHGEWGCWLKDEVEFSQSTANNFMKLFKEYGADQITLFGAVINSQALENLPYTKALQLLAIPSEEREEFAREVGAEDLSSRELATVIKERDEARKAAEDAAAREVELKKRAEEAEATALRAEQTAAEAEELKQEAEKLADELEKAKRKADKLHEQLNRAKSDPRIPPEKLAEIKAEAEAAVKEEIDRLNKSGEAELHALKERLAEAEKTAQAAEEKRLIAIGRLEEAEKRIKLSSPEVAEFRVLYDEIQLTAEKLIQKAEIACGTDNEIGKKLYRAIAALGAQLIQASKKEEDNDERKE